MNLKATTRYQIWEYKKSVMVFYLVVVLVMAFFSVLISIDVNSNVRSEGGITMSSVIFLFVAGLNSFKESFHMMLQNGISRKTMFYGRILSAGLLCIIMALIDAFMMSIIGIFKIERFKMDGIYEQMFVARTSDMNFLTKNLESLIFMFCLYLGSIAFGYLITVAYYRMNKAVKVAVSVGVPVGLFLVLPIVDYGLTQGRISNAISKFILFITGFEKQNPYYFIVSSAVAAALCFGLSWLLIRKAVDKN